MNSHERFQFDLEGYLLIKGVLTDSEATALNTAVDDNFKTYPYGEVVTGKETSLISWARAVKDLINHPTVLPYLVELLGPGLRLDHDYGMFMNKGDGHD